MESGIYHYKEAFRLESGIDMPGFNLAYTTLGQLNEKKDNVIWIFHALTGSSHANDWWAGLVGNGKLFDPDKYYIICANMPGSCYGSTGPLDMHPATGEPWYHAFPFFTPRDMARAFQHLKRFLGIDRIFLGIGGSMGGQHLLEWSVEEPELFERMVPIATNAYHSAWGRAFNASQRMCIESDPTWKDKDPHAGIEGMKVARSIALLSYRHYETYAMKQVDDKERIESFRSESYQRYQGEKLAARFNAFSYYCLSKGMDSHHLGRGRVSAEAALKKIKSKTLVIGIDTDILFPLSEQEFLAKHIPDAHLAVLSSAYGHDAFLVEYEKMEDILRHFTGA